MTTYEDQEEREERKQREKDRRNARRNKHPKDDKAPDEYQYDLEGSALAAECWGVAFYYFRRYVYRVSVQ